MASSCDNVDKIPLILIVLLPFSLISRLIIISLSATSIPNSSRIEVIFSSQPAKTPSTIAFFAPTLIIEVEALSPNNNPIASMIIDLPAPVSPVKTVKPSEKSIIKLSIIAKF